jgi:hypothetical protein
MFASPSSTTDDVDKRIGSEYVWLCLSKRVVQRITRINELVVRLVMFALAKHQ